MSAFWDTVSTCSDRMLDSCGGSVPDSDGLDRTLSCCRREEVRLADGGSVNAVVAAGFLKQSTRNSDWRCGSANARCGNAAPSLHVGFGATPKSSRVTCSLAAADDTFPAAGTGLHSRPGHGEPHGSGPTERHSRSEETASMTSSSVPLSAGSMASAAVAAAAMERRWRRSATEATGMMARARVASRFRFWEAPMLFRGEEMGWGSLCGKGVGVVGSGVSDVTRLGPTCPYMNMDREVSERACVRVTGNQSIATNF